MAAENQPATIVGKLGDGSAPSKTVRGVISYASSKADIDMILVRQIEDQPLLTDAIALELKPGDRIAIADRRKPPPDAASKILTLPMHKWVELRGYESGGYVGVNRRASKSSVPFAAEGFHFRHTFNVTDARRSSRSCPSGWFCRAAWFLCRHRCQYQWCRRDRGW